MDNPLGKSFSIPEYLTNSVKTINNEKTGSYESARMFMEEVKKLNNNLQTILEEHMEVLHGFDYSVDVEKMIVTITGPKLCR